MASKNKCIHCDNKAVPVVQNNTNIELKHIRVCRQCYGTKDYHEFPFSYEKVFEKNHARFSERLPSIPPAFLGSDIQRFPEGMRNAYYQAPKILTKDAEKPNMILHGPTGWCKTRAAWEIANAYWVNNWPCSVEVYSMRRLEKEIEESFGEYGSSVKGHGKFIDRICDIDLLVIDDLGKEQMTPRMEADLFAIIDTRTINRKSTIITTNHVGDGIVGRFKNKETGEPFVRRLREFFVPFTVSA